VNVGGKRVTEQCRRCGGSGWQCESHPDQPADHLLANGEHCGGPGVPCGECGCPDGGTLKGWQSCVGAHAREDALSEELVRLSRQAHETFGLDTYQTAYLRASAIGRQNPNDPRAWHVALRDELKRLLGPH
jgi:hypothetical protein